MSNNTIRLQRDIVTVRYDEPDYDEVQHVVIMGSDSIIGTRPVQQDSYYVGYGEEQSLLTVCDGMGGMEGGERASQTAVRVLAEDYEKQMIDNIPLFYEEEAVRLDSIVHDLKNDAGERMDGGTTIVSAIIRDNHLFWLSVGDSRIYIIRKDEIAQVNRDHNYKYRLNMQLENGQIDEEEYTSKMKKGEALISYIGMGNVSMMDVNRIPFELQDEDVVLLCSDGLYKRLTDQEILEIVRSELPDVDAAAKALTRMVMERTTKSQDNTTVILAQYNQY